MYRWTAVVDGISKLNRKAISSLITRKQERSTRHFVSRIMIGEAHAGFHIPPTNHMIT